MPWLWFQGHGSTCLCYNEASVVGVVEGLRRQVVALEIEGSIPSAHPIFLLL